MNTEVWLGQQSKDNQQTTDASADSQNKDKKKVDWPPGKLLALSLSA